MRPRLFVWPLTWPLTGSASREGTRLIHLCDPCTRHHRAGHKVDTQRVYWVNVGWMSQPQTFIYHLWEIMTIIHSGTECVLHVFVKCFEISSRKGGDALKNSTGGGYSFSTLSSSIATFPFFSINFSAGLQVKKPPAKKNNQLIA